MNPTDALGWFFVVAFGAYLLHVFRKFRENSSTFDKNEASAASNAITKQSNDSLYNIQQRKQQQQQQQATVSSKTTGKSNQKQHQRSGASSSGALNKRSDKTYTHSWCLTSLKGHTDQVYDVSYSSNGKYLASCAEDRTLLLWTAQNIGDTQQRKCVRVNVEYDHAARLAWSPDSKALLIHKALENCIEVIRIEKKDGLLANPTKALTFPAVHKGDVCVGFGIACTGRFIMSCSNKTDIVLWTLKGKTLDKLDTCLSNNASAKISTCGRFIAACGFSPDVKVWEVKFNKTGEYLKTENVFNLSGHNSGVHDMAFDQDTSHIATVSKDGTWKLFNTKISYEQGQSPSCLITAKYAASTAANASLIALSPTGQVIAIATGCTVELFSGLDGVRDAVIENIYETPITALLFDPLGKYFLTAGDRHVRVFHNVTGYKVTAEAARLRLKEVQTSTTRERLEQTIAECNQFVASIM